MFGLTFPQPFATLMALGFKRMDARQYGTTWRGVLAIHAAPEFPSEYRELCLKEPYRSWLISAGYLTPDALTTGAIVGFCYLEDSGIIPSQFSVPPSERLMSNFPPGQTAYLFSGALPIKNPIPIRAGLQVWRVNLPGLPWNIIADQVMQTRSEERNRLSEASPASVPEGLQVVEGDLWEVGGPDTWRVVTTSLARKGKRSVTSTRAGSEATKRHPWLPEWYEEQRRSGKNGVIVCREEGTRLVMFPEQPAPSSASVMPFLAAGLQQLQVVQRELNDRLVMPVPGVDENRPLSEKEERLNLVSHYLQKDPVTVVIGDRKKAKARA